MKKLLIMAAAAVALALFSCSKSAFGPDTGNMVEGTEISFEGEMDISKTIMLDESVGHRGFEWVKGDGIGITMLKNGSVATWDIPYEITKEGTDGKFVPALPDTAHAWTGDGTYAFYAMYPRTNLSGGLTSLDSYTYNGIDNTITQKGPNNSTHMARYGVMMATSTVNNSSLDPEQVVTLTFRHLLSFMEFRMTADTNTYAHKITKIDITTFNGTTIWTNLNLYFRLPAGTVRSNYNDAQVISLKFPEPISLTTDVIKAWIPVYPGTYSSSGNQYLFKIYYDNGAFKNISKSGTVMVAGHIQPVNMDVTPPDKIYTAHYELTVPAGTTVQAAAAAAISNGDIEVEEEILRIVYKPATLLAADVTYMKNMTFGKGVTEIVIENVLTITNEFTGMQGIKKLKFSNVKTFGSINTCPSLQELDFGTNPEFAGWPTQYNVMTGLTGLKVLKFGSPNWVPVRESSPGVFNSQGTSPVTEMTSLSADVLKGVDLYLGTYEYTNADKINAKWKIGTKGGSTVSGTQFKSIRQYQ